jgi:hypothetical protein
MAKLPFYGDAGIRLYWDMTGVPRNIGTATQKTWICTVTVATLYVILVPECPNSKGNDAYSKAPLLYPCLSTMHFFFQKCAIFLWEWLGQL